MRSYNFDEAADASKPRTWLHQYELAEPCITGGIVEGAMQAMQTPFLENLDENDAGDPRLGTPIILAKRWDPPTSAALLKLSGRPGASPHQ